MTTHGPLNGTRVVELGQFIAGPGTSMLLGDLGAEVIKVEPIEGDASRTTGRGAAADGIFVAYNRNKRSITLNLRSEPARNVLRSLVGTADIFVQNARPGLMAELKLGTRELRSAHPALIYVSLAGFPSDGPSADRRGFDIAAQAESGMMSITGEPGSEPLKVGFAIVDAASNLAACTAILAALVRQRATGLGDEIEVSLFEVAVQLQSQIWSEYTLTGIEPTRVGNRQPHAAPAADIVTASDGQLVVSAYQNSHWASLCRTIGRPELIDDELFSTNAARVANGPAMIATLNDTFSSMTVDSAWELLQRSGIVVGKVRRYSEVIACGDAVGSGIFANHITPDGRTAVAANPPFRLASSPRASAAPVPSTGQHTVDVLRELGIDDDEISSLLRNGDAGATVVMSS